MSLNLRNLVFRFCSSSVKSDSRFFSNPVRKVVQSACSDLSKSKTVFSSIVLALYPLNSSYCGVEKNMQKSVIFYSLNLLRIKYDPIVGGFFDPMTVFGLE